MSRRGSVSRKEINPDPLYESILVARLINYIMKDGKKSAAERAVYGAFRVIEKKIKKEPKEVFDEAVRNIRPSVEVRSRRVGGATYQVPTDVRDSRSIALALRWIVEAASKRGEKTMAEKLAGEIIDAINNRGGAIKVKEDKRKMAEANRAFAHFRWN
jgi:small subunit ribosomal protein S7